MYNKILIATELSPRSKNALKKGKGYKICSLF